LQGFSKRPRMLSINAIARAPGRARLLGHVSSRLAGRGGLLVRPGRAVVVQLEPGAVCRAIALRGMRSCRGSESAESFRSVTTRPRSSALATEEPSARVRWTATRSAVRAPSTVLSLTRTPSAIALSFIPSSRRWLFSARSARTRRLCASDGRDLDWDSTQVRILCDRTRHYPEIVLSAQWRILAVSA
jgi:hypothetical protein